MDKDLMNKEVLVILDTRQIQKFMFKSNTFYDTIGASDLMTHVLQDAILYALTHVDPPLREDQYSVDQTVDVETIPYFASEEVQFQIIMCAAGNALCIVRTGALAQQIIRRISRYYLDNTRSLNLAAAAVAKTDDMGHDIFELYKKLNAVKAACEVSNPLGPLAIIKRENKTGESVTSYDEQNADFVSMASELRRKESSKRGTLISKEEMFATQMPDGRSYQAVIHADGNNLGITIGRILQNTKSYEEGIRKRRLINKNISENYDRIVKATIGQLRDYYQSLGKNPEDFPREFQLIHQAGDDVNIICNASLAFIFMEYFYKNLDNSYLMKYAGEEIPLYVCAGIAFVTRDIDYHMAFGFAEECCDSAKTMAKKEENLRNGLAGNWIDFQVYKTKNVQELDMLRLKSYTTYEGINLTLRPYCFDEVAKAEPYFYGNFRSRIDAINKLKLNESDISNLIMSYNMGRKNFNQYIAKLKANGLDLIEALGQPLYKCGDEEKAVWRDAFSLRSLFEEGGEQA